MNYVAPVKRVEHSIYVFINKLKIKREEVIEILNTTLIINDIPDNIDIQTRQLKITRLLNMIRKAIKFTNVSTFFYYNNLFYYNNPEITQPSTSHQPNTILVYSNTPMN